MTRDAVKVAQSTGFGLTGIYYDKAMAKFRTRAAAYVYLSTDGDLPKTVPSQNLDTKAKIVSYWQGQSTFVTGLTQETCRDFTHTGYGISAISHVAETSRIQGQDLYGQHRAGIRQLTPGARSYSTCSSSDVAANGRATPG